jgi:hypothetical protein
MLQESTEVCFTLLEETDKSQLLQPFITILSPIATIMACRRGAHIDDLGWKLGKDLKPPSLLWSVMGEDCCKNKTKPC